MLRGLNASSRGLISPCPLLSSFFRCLLSGFLLLDVVPLVSHCLPVACVGLCVSWIVLLSHQMCAHVGFCVHLRGVLCCRVLSCLVSLVSPDVCPCWNAHPPSQALVLIVSHCFRFVSIACSLTRLCWYPPSRSLVFHGLPLFPSVSLRVCWCWMVCPPSRSCLPLFPRMCLC